MTPEAKAYCEAQARRIAELEAENAEKERATALYQLSDQQLRKDAARYRYLKGILDVAIFSSEVHFNNIYTKQVGRYELDFAIDAAMKGK